MYDRLVQYKIRTEPIVVSAAPENLTLDKWDPKLPNLIFRRYEVVCYSGPKFAGGDGSGESDTES